MWRDSAIIGAMEGGAVDVRDLEKLVAQGEGMSFEFKRCGGDKIERDVFETVCSFANR